MELTKSIKSFEGIVFNVLLNPNDFEHFKSELKVNAQLQIYLGDKISSAVLQSESLNTDLMTVIHKRVALHKDVKAFENYKIVQVLSRLTKRNKQFIPALYQSYELYADGYHFMETVGVQYGLSFSNTYFDYFEWEKLDLKQKRESIQQIFPSVKNEALKILECLHKDKIQVTGVKNREGLFTYIDRRSDFEHLTTYESYATNRKRYSWPIVLRRIKRKFVTTNMRRK